MSKTVQNYAKQMLTLYRTICRAAQIKEAQPYYRIVQLPNENDKHLHFQIVGKNVVLNMSPEKIMREDILLGFNKAEIVLITHLGTKNEISSDFSIPKNKLFKIISNLGIYKIISEDYRLLFFRDFLWGHRHWLKSF